jgi:hypothetical protein
VDPNTRQPVTGPTQFGVDDLALFIGDRDDFTEPADINEKS